MGVISPVGSTLSDAWSRVVEGRSGIRTIESYDVSQYPTRFAGLVDGFDADDYLGAREQRRTDAFVQKYSTTAQAIATDATMIT